MKEKWGKLSQPVKTMILVWAPIIALGIVYGSTYTIKYNLAKSAIDADYAQYQKCEANVTRLENNDMAKETTIDGVTYHNSTAVKALAEAGYCQSVSGSIKHGFLGLPYYGQ